MKRLLHFFWLALAVLSPSFFSQSVESLGLENKHITTLKIGEGIIAVGTHSNGVYWQSLYNVTDSSWKFIDVNKADVKTVYPHKSGPIGWAIGIGAEPNLNDSNYIFCSFLGGTVRRMSYGIEKNNSPEISEIDGFPDPTICGETFAIGGRVLYRRYFNDTIWQPISYLSEGSFATLKAREENAYVYAGGAEGFTGMLLMRSSDKGSSWEGLSPMCYVADVDFWGEGKHKIFVTDQFKIRRSLDGGTNWTDVFSDDTLMIQKISLSSNGKIIYAITNSRNLDLPGTVLLTSTDDGENWEKTQLPIYDIISGMDVDNANYIYLASISEGIFRVKSPIVNIEDESKNISPDEFKLEQNYPNPFNPSTAISYQLPTVSNVSLKIYDFLGQEVATLVNKQQNAGNYSVDFNASNLTSGIYFYRMKSGKFVQTRKLLLMK